MDERRDVLGVSSLVDEAVELAEARREALSAWERL